MKFVLCVPTYNEQGVIIETVSELSYALSSLNKEVCWEIVIADNGSTDFTRDVVLESGYSNVLVKSIPQKGKGIAIRSVSVNTDADFFGFIDADLSADPAVIPEMLQLLINGEYDIVVGSRFSSGGSTERLYWRSFSSKVFNVFQRLILNVKVSDTQCGLKIMNKKGIALFNMCSEKTWFFDVEFLHLAEKSKLKTREHPIKWQEYRYKNRKSKLNVFREGFFAVFSLIRIKLR